MDRKTLLGAGALGALAVLAAWGWLDVLDAPRAAQARTASVLLSARATPARRLPAAIEAGAADRPQPQALSGATTLAHAHETLAELSEADAKEVGKLDKKLDKAQTRQAKAELKLALVADQLAAAELALEEALALPEGKAKDKAVAKWTKQVAKLAGKLDKAQEKLAAAEAAAGALVAQIEALDPGHFGDISGLQAPEEMQVVTAETGAGGGQGFWGGGGSALLGGGDFPLGSDFNTDPVNEHVFDPSMQVLQSVDGILCFMARTAYDAMVNGGLYVAQVDEGQCENGDGGGDAGQSSGAGAEEPTLAIVKCVRDSGTGEQVVSFWLPGHGGPSGDESVTIRAKMTVLQGVSEGDPFGRFKMDFAGVAPGQPVSQALMHGTLMTLDVLEGFIGFSFFEESGDLEAEVLPEFGYAERVQANVNMFDDQSQGVARVRRQWRENFPPHGDTGVQTEEYLLAFDDDSVIRTEVGGGSACLSREQFEARTFRYTLYEASGGNAGARVERNGGFNIRTADGDFGWAGYWGLWLPPGAELDSGDVVERATWGQEAPETYTVLEAPGKLIRNTRQQLALEDADGETFEWWEFPLAGEPGGGGPGGGPQAMPTQWRIGYDHGTATWSRLAQFDPGLQQWTDLPQPEAIDLQEVGFLQMFSPSLGGSVSYVAGEAFLTYFKMEFVNANDPLFAGGGDVPLYGYLDCVAGALTAQQAEAGQVFQPNSFDVQAPHAYLMRRDDMTLYVDEEGDQSNLVACGLAAGEVPQSGPFTWGLRTGPLLPDTSGLSGTFELWNQPVFYTWETGPNPWNRLTLLLDAQGDAVAFDPPLQFSYEHTLENDAAGDPTWAGKTFLLNYNGPGDLWGIPMQPFDLDEDGFPDRWYPQFSIADGALLGPGGEYVIKGIEKELTLMDGDPQICANQTTDPVAGLALPDGSEYEAPDIGPAPVLDEPPSVIDGEPQLEDAGP